MGIWLVTGEGCETYGFEVNKSLQISEVQACFFVESGIEFGGKRAGSFEICSFRMMVYSPKGTPPPSMKSRGSVGREIKYETKRVE